MPELSEEKILSICATKAKHGEYFTVNRYMWRHTRLRAKLFDMKKRGLLVYAGIRHKDLQYYRPQDKEIIQASWDKHALEMKKIHAKNVDWHLEQSKKYEVGSLNYNYCMREAEKERKLAA